MPRLLGMILGIQRGNRANARQRVANPNFVEANTDLTLSKQKLEEAKKAFDKSNRGYQE